jgi:hypothetical protein
MNAINTFKSPKNNNIVFGVHTLEESMEGESKFLQKSMIYQKKLNKKQNT